MTDQNFARALQQAEKIVETWPSWKQNSLLVTTMAKSPASHQPPTDNNTAHNDCLVSQTTKSNHDQKP